MLTLANLLSGAAAIVFALQYHDYTTSFMLIIASAIFDFFDGFAARMLGQSSPIGACSSTRWPTTYRSVWRRRWCSTTPISPPRPYYAIDAQISDAMRFGVLIIAAFSALRLARFNIDDTQHTEFRGLPTPAATLLCVSLAVLFQQGHIVLYREQILLIALAVALLLVSPIRMFALKFTSFSPEGNMLRYGFLLTSLLLIIFCTTYSVTLIIVLYIVVSTLRWIVGHSTEDRI